MPDLPATLSSAATLRKRLHMRHLRLALALAEHRSLRRAAAQMALSQPAVTKALHELESVVGTLLFTRHARGIEPTVFGEALIRYARVVLADLDALHDEFAAIAAGEVGKVRLGSILAPVLASYFLKRAGELKSEDADASAAAPALREARGEAL